MSEKRYRDAVTGEYVTQEYAEKHPRRTVSETVERDEPEPEPAPEPTPVEEEN